MARSVVARVFGRPLSDKEKLVAGMAFTFTFMLVEAFFALLAGSLAMLGDAAHMLTDAASFAVSLGALHIAERGPTAKHTYGLARVEVLGALASTLGLWLVTGVLISESARRIRAYCVGDAEPVDGRLMVLLGCLGICTNLMLERVLGAHSHGFGGHDHGHGGHDDHAHGGHAHGGGGGHDSGHAHAAAHGHDAGHAHGDACCGNPLHDRGHAHGADEEAGHGHGGATDHDRGHGHDAGAHDSAHGHDAAHAHGAAASHDAAHEHGAARGHDSAHAHGAARDDDHGGHARGKPSAKTPLAGASTTGYSAVAVDEGAPPPAPRRQINIDAAYLHVLGDLLQNLGVVVAGAIIWAKPHWQVVDPLVTLVFAAIVLYTTVGLLQRAAHILLEAAPDDVDAAALQAALARVPGVGDVHDVHVWELTADRPAMSCHVILAAGGAHDAVLVACTDVAAAHGVDHATIQVQGPGACIAKTCCSVELSNR